MLESLPQFTNLGEESRRLLHGRGGFFPQLEHVAIDWFAPVLLVTFYAETELNSLLVTSLTKSAQANSSIAAIVVQRRHLPKAPKDTVYGTLPAEVWASESGLRYHLSLNRNQNHGFFLDMKPGRDWIRAQAEGKRVLNLFAYTCSLSVAAIGGGAETVFNLDMASGALTTGRRNHQLNYPQDVCQRARYLPHDLFKSWGRLVREAPYDLIVIDPPSNQGKQLSGREPLSKNPSSPPGVAQRRLPDSGLPQCAPSRRIVLDQALCGLLLPRTSALCGRLRGQGPHSRSQKPSFSTRLSDNHSLADSPNHSTSVK